MDGPEALALLGLEEATETAAVRAAFRRQVRQHHPDVAGPGTDARAARLIEAYELVLSVVRAGGTLTRPDTAVPTEATPREPAPAAPPDPAPAQATGAEGATDRLDEDTIAVLAPPDEVFGLVHEAASRVGEVAYVDPHLGLLEVVVRFEGGPTCSVVLSLQGRALHTEVFCTMESIEAAPTPPLRPVVEALVAELQALV